MTYDEFNAFCRALPATTYVQQWGGSHVWKVGGKVFAIGGWGDSGRPAFIFKASDLNFDVLKDEPGFRPAPYMASRGLKWIQQTETAKTKDEPLRYYLGESYRMVSAKLSKKKRKELGITAD